MAYKLTWSPAARDDLHDIIVFVARDNPNREMSFGFELMSETGRLQEFPELGRIVPEYRNDCAPETLSEGEFNRFYARGLCRFALNSGIARLQVYRAKAVMVARSVSEAMIGIEIEAAALLEDLRTHQGVDTALGLPPGPNSGLSIKLPHS